MLDLFLVYQMIRRLATPFKEWDAYKLGIIDEKGRVLKNRKDLKTSKEKKAFGVYDVMLLNIKKMIEKLPGGSNKLSSYAAALYLIREWNHFSSDSLLTEDIDDEYIEQTTRLFFNGYTDYNTLPENVNKKMHSIDDLFEQRFSEEAPTVNVGSGNIAGLGVGPQGEPGITLPQMKRYKKKNRNKVIRDIIGANI